MTRTWSVTEATESAAFLSDDTGEDVAVLQRLPADLFESSSPLAGDEWQAMIDLVAAAPEMLEALKDARSAITYMMSNDDCGGAANALEAVVAAIAKAEGRE